jgi:hypothetical protein
MITRFILLATILLAHFPAYAQEIKFPKIDRYPPPADYSSFRHRYDSFPNYNPNSQDPFQIDLRNCDLTKFNLASKGKDLQYAVFDTETTFPKRIPASFNPNKIMDLGKNPGLGVKKLHNEGITGKDVGVAIIDMGLVIDHTEYKDRLRLYEENNYVIGTADLHGPAMASLVAGKSVGVAPEADLYYIAEIHGKVQGRGANIQFTSDLGYTAKSIDRIIEINKSLPAKKKIRAISVSVGFTPKSKGYKEIMDAIFRATKDGIFAITVGIEDYYKDINLFGLGREPLADPDKVSSYSVGEFLEKDLTYLASTPNKLFVPMDSRTTASPTGPNSYTFYRVGGMSCAVPYLAGLYALACQVKPDITPEYFLSQALKTGDSTTVEKNGKRYQLEKIVNPVKLIESLCEKKK